MTAANPMPVVSLLPVTAAAELSSTAPEQGLLGSTLESFINLVETLISESAPVAEGEATLSTSATPRTDQKPVLRAHSHHAHLGLPEQEKVEGASSVSSPPVIPQTVTHTSPALALPKILPDRPEQQRTSTESEPGEPSATTVAVNVDSATLARSILSRAFRSTRASVRPTQTVDTQQPAVRLLAALSRGAGIRIAPETAPEEKMPSDHSSKREPSDSALTSLNSSARVLAPIPSQDATEVIRDVAQPVQVFRSNPVPPRAAPASSEKARKREEPFSALPVMESLPIPKAPHVVPTAAAPAKSETPVNLPAERSELHEARRQAVGMEPRALPLPQTSEPSKATTPAPIAFRVMVDTKDVEDVKAIAPETAGQSELPAVLRAAAPTQEKSDQSDSQHEGLPGQRLEPVVNRKPAATQETAHPHPTSDRELKVKPADQRGVDHAASQIARPVAVHAYADPEAKIPEAVHKSAESKPLTSTTSPESASEVPKLSKAPVRDVVVRIPAGNQQVEVHIVEREGKVHVTVRSPDANLSTSLRTELGQLVQKLESHGMKAETWTPSETWPLAGPRPPESTSFQNGTDWSGSSWDGQQQNQQQQERRRQSGEGWLAELERGLSEEE